MSRFESIDRERLGWFVGVAEALHFARAAKSLGISRQRLSHAVIDLETELGTKLFVPGAQPTQLTEAGEALLAYGREHLVVAESVQDELRIGIVPGVTVSKWTTIWAQRFPHVPLHVVAVAMKDQETALRARTVDMCFVRLPIDRGGMSAIPLYREVPVVVVPKEHPISVFDEVTRADLAGERLQDAVDLDDAAMTLELVAASVGLAIVPHSIARLHARRDLVFRTVTDAPDTQIALAWPADATTELVEEFVGVVRGRSERSTRTTTTRTGKQPRVKRSGKPDTRRRR